MSREGWVYFLATSNRQYVKVGRTIDVNKRIGVLKIQLPFPVDLVHAIRTNDAVWLESLIHSEWESRRANGEWFWFNKDEWQFVNRWRQYDYWDRQRQAKRDYELKTRVSEIEKNYPFTSPLYEMEDYLNAMRDAVWEAGQ